MTRSASTALQRRVSQVIVAAVLATAVVSQPVLSQAYPSGWLLEGLFCIFPDEEAAAAYRDRIQETAARAGDDDLDPSAAWCGRKWSGTVQLLRRIEFLADFRGGTFLYDPVGRLTCRFNAKVSPPDYDRDFEYPCAFRPEVGTMYFARFVDRDGNTLYDEPGRDLIGVVEVYPAFVRLRPGERRF